MTRNLEHLEVVFAPDGASFACEGAGTMSSMQAMMIVGREVTKLHAQASAKRQQIDSSQQQTASLQAELDRLDAAAEMAMNAWSHGVYVDHDVSTVHINRPRSRSVHRASPDTPQSVQAQPHTAPEVTRMEAPVAANEDSSSPALVFNEHHGRPIHQTDSQQPPTSTRDEAVHAIDLPKPGHDQSRQYHEMLRAIYCSIDNIMQGSGSTDRLYTLESTADSAQTDLYEDVLLANSLANNLDNEILQGALTTEAVETAVPRDVAGKPNMTLGAHWAEKSADILALLHALSSFVADNHRNLFRAYSRRTMEHEPKRKRRRVTHNGRAIAGLALH